MPLNKELEQLEHYIKDFIMFRTCKAVERINKLCKLKSYEGMSKYMMQEDINKFIVYDIDGFPTFKTFQQNLKYR